MEHEEKKGERKGRKACGEGGVFRDLVRRSSRRTQPEMRLLLSERSRRAQPAGNHAASALLLPSSPSPQGRSRADSCTTLDLLPFSAILVL